MTTAARWYPASAGAGIDCGRTAGGPASGPDTDAAARTSLEAATWYPGARVTGGSITLPTWLGGAGPSARTLGPGTRPPPTSAAATAATIHGVAAARIRRRPRCVRAGARVL